MRGYAPTMLTDSRNTYRACRSRYATEPTLTQHIAHLSGRTFTEPTRILELPKHKVGRTFTDIGGRRQYSDPQAAGSGFKSLMAHEKPLLSRGSFRLKISTKPPTQHFRAETVDHMRHTERKGPGQSVARLPERLDSQSGFAGFKWSLPSVTIRTAEGTGHTGPLRSPSGDGHCANLGRRTRTALPRGGRLPGNGPTAKNADERVDGPSHRR